MKINTLTKDIIYECHLIGIEKYGGNPATDENTEGKIESITSQQYEIFGVDKYPSIFQKAAMLLYFIIKDHCFKDGNKRTSVLAVFVFLQQNGYDVIAPKGSIKKFAEEIAESEYRGIEIDRYINKISKIIRYNVQAI